MTESSRILEMPPSTAIKVSKKNSRATNIIKDQARNNTAVSRKKPSSIAYRKNRIKRNRLTISSRKLKLGKTPIPPIQKSLHISTKLKKSHRINIIYIHYQLSKVLVLH
jgi:hypothetical protein